MTNVRNTKRAFFASAMALILCFTMLLGTTYAWFTDTVTSTGNKIQAGTLKIDLEMLVKDDVNNTTTWTSIKTSKAPIFDYTKWEPGYTDVKLLKVENEGSLALKWKALIVSDAALSELANVIDVYVLPYGVLTDNSSVVYPTTRDLTGYNKVGTVKEFVTTIETTTVGTLKAGEAAYLGIALKMQEEANNTYQNMDLGAFDIQILATQLNYEEDSIDENYDKDLDPSAGGIEKELPDGSTVFYYDEAGPNAGVVQLTKLPASFTSGDEYVIPAEVNALSGALAGQHFSKLTVPAGVTFARKHLQGSTIDEVVLEEGLTTIPDRMFYQTNVQNVVIPDSVTKIEQYAFSQAHVKNLVIPASVTTLEEGCFAYMPNLETVVFEGDVTLPKYAFRACPKLAKVEFEGDVIVASTSMIFSNYESGGKDNMSFYVNSQANADELITCLGTYNDTNTGKDRNQWTIYVNGTVSVNVKNATELQKALDNATVDTVINITADITGDITALKVADADVTINGGNKNFTGVLTVTGNADTGSLTIKDVNFIAKAGATSAIYAPQKYDNGNKNNYVKNLTVDGCTFVDPANDRDCAALRASSGGKQYWTIKNCTVDSTMHSFIQADNIEKSLVVEKCTVSSKNGANLGQGAVLDMTECNFDVSGYAVRFGVAGTTVNGNFSIKDSTLKSSIDEADDAVIIFRGTMTGSTLTLTNTTLVGTPDVKGVANIVHN